jgi:hypothetical protein
MITLSKNATNRLKEAEATGFLVSRKSYDEMLRYAWVQHCCESNQPCVYVIVSVNWADIYVNVATSAALWSQSDLEAIGNMCRWFVHSPGLLKRTHDGYKLESVSLSRVPEACTTILAALQ